MVTDIISVIPLLGMLKRKQLTTIPSLPIQTTITLYWKLSSGNYINKHVHIKRLQVIYKIWNSSTFQRQGAIFRESKLQILKPVTR